jgi:hypothetical protein
MEAGMSWSNSALLCAALLALSLRPAAAVAADKKVSDLVKGFDDSEITKVYEKKSEISQVGLGFVIRGGGALVLCEPGHLKTAGLGGGCTGSTTDDVSDVLAFVADGKNKTLTFYSDPALDFKLDLDSLKTKFGPYVAYVEEGGYFDERDSTSGKIIGRNATIYIRKSGTAFTRAFELFSDTNETEPMPEPAAWMTMLLGFGAAGALLRRRRPGGRRTPSAEALGLLD